MEREKPGGGGGGTNKTETGKVLSSASALLSLHKLRPVNTVL